MIHMVAADGKKLMDKRNGRKYSEVYCLESEAQYFVEVDV